MAQAEGGSATEQDIAVAKAQIAYDTARQKEANDIPQAEAALRDAQQQYDALLKPTANDLIQAQAAVTQVQASLTKLRQGGTAADITQSKAQIVQAQANLDRVAFVGKSATLNAHEALDLSVPQFRTLRFVARHPATSLSDLADHLGMTLPAASKLVDRLLEQRLIARATATGDRRRAELTLTPHGQAALQVAAAAAQDRLTERLSMLSEQERSVHRHSAYCAPVSHQPHMCRRKPLPEQSQQPHSTERDSPIARLT
ncbi:MAG: MarR family transcriptional regulator [Roseiflexaceae bacterium]|nr:MarR family transcriptional regulator [Roseiflexaceae bacterium]